MACWVSCTNNTVRQIRAEALRDGLRHKYLNLPRHGKLVVLSGNAAKETGPLLWRTGGWWKKIWSTSYPFSATDVSGNVSRRAGWFVESSTKRLSAVVDLSFQQGYVFSLCAIVDALPIGQAIIILRANFAYRRYNSALWRRIPTAYGNNSYKRVGHNWAGSETSTNMLELSVNHSTTLAAKIRFGLLGK